MKSIISAFNQICSQKYKPLGFVKIGQGFVCMGREVFHTFALKQGSLKRKVTVEFGVVPLCANIWHPMSLHGGAYELHQFNPDLYMNFGWYCDLDSEDNIINCAMEISEAIDSYVLPLFEKCKDCKTALTVLPDLEELFDQNRKEVLRRIGEVDCAMPWQESSLYDGYKYYMALKAKNWDYARRYLVFLIHHYEEKLREFNLPDAPKQPPWVKPRFEAQLNELCERLDRLSYSDFAFFNDMVNRNESQTLEFIKSKYPKLYANYH